MAEQTHIQQVTAKDPKKVKQGKKLAEWRRQSREKLKAQKRESETKLTSGQYYGAGVIVATGVLGSLVYQYKALKETLSNQTNEALVH